MTSAFHLYLILAASSVITTCLVHLLLFLRLSTASLSTEDLEFLPRLPVESAVALEGDVEDETEGRQEEVLTCIKENIGSALIQAMVVMEKMNEFKDDYTMSKFKTNWTESGNLIPEAWDYDILEVCSVDQTCSTVLPSLPSTASPPATDSEVASTLNEIFGHILRFLFAFEQMVLEQGLREDIFAEQMYDTYTNHEVLASRLEDVYEKCGLQPNTSVLEPLQGKMYVDTSQTQADIRGFSTLRQSLQGLQLLLDMFLEERTSIRRVKEEEKEEVEEEQDEEERRDRRRRRRNRRKNGSREKKNGNESREKKNRNESREKKNGKNRKVNKNKRRRSRHLD